MKVLFAFASAALVSSLALEADNGMPCPGSSSFIHASCEQTASIDADCSAVVEEITARVKAQATGDWYDPHNRGTYSITSASDTTLQLTRVTGDKKYTDKMTVTLSGSSGTCTLQGCSESQTTSVADFSTNYCNVRMLYCGSADGCKPINDFTSTVTNTSPSVGAGSSMSDCLKV